MGWARLADALRRRGHSVEAVPPLFYLAGVYDEQVGDPLPTSTFILPVEPVEIPGGHCPHVSHPETVAEIVSP